MKACFHFRAERAANKEYPAACCGVQRASAASIFASPELALESILFIMRFINQKKTLKLEKKHLNYFGQAYSRLKLRISDSLKTF